MPDPDLQAAILRLELAAGALERCRTNCIDGWSATVAASRFEGRYAREITGQFDDTMARLGRIKGALDDRRAEYERLQAQATEEPSG